MWLAPLLALALACAPAIADSALPPLVWHVETPEGEPLSSKKGDVAINPASVVKVATTLWALDRLGPDHRFVTRVALHGTLDPASGRGSGTLVVHGGADPDFHVENALLIAAELNRLGLRSVDGTLRIDDRFWMGWEGGSEKTERDQAKRARMMAERLRAAFDPARWTPLTRRTWQAFAARRGLDAAQPPALTVGGGAGRLEAPPEAGPALAVEHFSNPLGLILKRFNAHSNNDIDRFAATLGPAEELARTMFGPTARLETLSGLGSNRLTPRQVVELMRRLERRCAELGLSIDAVLPVAGCDPGTLQRYPRLADSAAGAIVAKTGTLVDTDGGVAAIAGLLRGGSGDRLFCAAMPGSGHSVTRARATLETWLLDQVAAAGGAPTTLCPPPPVLSDAAAWVAPAN